MKPQTVVTALGAGVTTLLLVTVVAIELLPISVSTLVGIPFGIVTGLFVSILVFGFFDQFDPATRRSIVAVAGFGYAVVALLVVSYVNLAGLRSEISVGRTIVLAFGLSVALYVDQWLDSRRTTD